LRKLPEAGEQASRIYMDKGSLQEGPGGFLRHPWEAKGGQSSAGPSFILSGLFPANMDGKQ